MNIKKNTKNTQNNDKINNQKKVFKSDQIITKNTEKSTKNIFKITGKN